MHSAPAAARVSKTMLWTGRVVSVLSLHDLAEHEASRCKPWSKIFDVKQAVLFGAVQIPIDAGEREVRSRRGELLTLFDKSRQHLPLPLLRMRREIRSPSKPPTGWIFALIPCFQRVANSITIAR